MIRSTLTIALGLLGLTAVLVGTSDRRTAGPTGRRDGVGVDQRPLIPSSRRLTDHHDAPSPFRLDGRRPSVRYGIAPLAQPAVIPKPPKPALALTGILWGAEPAGLILGIPGQEGEVVMRRGEERGGIRVTYIMPNRVRLEGMDTTWTLTVRTPW